MSTKLAGTLNANNQPIINVPDPINPLDAVNLQTLQTLVGNSLSYEAGENINSHTPVVLFNNQLFKTDINNGDYQFSYIGFTRTSVLSGQNVDVITEGTIHLSGWGLIPGSYYQLSNIPGGITNIAPVSTFFKQIVGYSQDSNTLLLLRDTPILTA